MDTTYNNYHQEWVYVVNERFSSTKMDIHDSVSFLVMQPHVFRRYWNLVRIHLHQIFDVIHYFHQSEDLNFRDFCDIFDNNFDSFFVLCLVHFYIRILNWHEEDLRYFYHKY